MPRATQPRPPMRCLLRRVPGYESSVALPLRSSTRERETVRLHLCNRPHNLRSSHWNDCDFCSTPWGTSLLPERITPSRAFAAAGHLFYPYTEEVQAALSLF